MSFKKSITLVAGGASGLGLGVAKRVAAQGGTAVVFDLPSQEKNIQEHLSNNFHFIPGDITSIEDVNNMVSQTVSRFNRIDNAIQTAGIGTARSVVDKKTTAEQRMKEFQRTVSINTVGTFNFITHVASQMSLQEPREADKSAGQLDMESRGSIVMTASIAAYEGQRGQAAYSASKGAIVGMTLPITRDLAKYKVRVNTVCPGLFATPLLMGLPEKARLALAASVPNPSRLGDPDEYAYLIEHICNNPMMNGECIRLDGALRMSM